MDAKVLINGAVFLYKDKAPFVPSGKSVAGALEYDEPNDSMKCHECGKFFKALARHVHKDHGMSARVYKRKHGLNQTSALVSESTRHKLSVKAKARHDKVGSPPAWSDPKRAKKAIEAKKKSPYTRRLSSSERRNAQGHCKAQLMQKIRDVSKVLKRTPSRSELDEYGVPTSSLVHHFGSLTEAVKLAGLVPNGNIGQKNHKKYSEEYLLRNIRLFAANHGRLPTASDYRRGIMGASRSAYNYRFGNLHKANKLALRKAN